MKKIFTLGLALAATALMNLGAQAQQYALRIGNIETDPIVNGDTVDYIPEEYEFDFMKQTLCNVIVENLTSDPILTTQEVEILSGPEGQYLEVCGAGQCPWNGQPYTVTPGLNVDKPVTVEVGLLPEYSGYTLVRCMVANAGTLDNAVEIFIRIHLSKNAIDAVETGAQRVFPNPTRGRVTVGETEYDLSGYPAGVYNLPVEGGAARVIKL